MTDIVLDEIRSGYNLQKINDNFEEIERVINEEVVHNTGGNNVMQQDFDMNSFKILNSPAPEDPTDLVRLQDIGDITISDGNIIIARDSQILTDGQTTVTFSNTMDARYAVVDIGGNGVDSRRLFLEDDYSIGTPEYVIELTESYPAGTKLVMSQGDIAGATEVNSVFGRSGDVVANFGDYEASEVSFDDTDLSINAANVQEATEEALLNNDIPNIKLDSTYTLVPDDRGKSVYMSNALPNTVTIDTNANQACDVDMVCMIRQLSAGLTTVSAVAGVTLNGVDGGSVDLDGQWKSVVLNQYATDSWWIEGMSGVVV